MSRAPFDWIDVESERRERAGLVRTLRPRAADQDLLDLASNDYLGLTRHPAVTAAAAEAAHRWGAGATGSRLVTGTTALHAELERELAEFCGFEAALVFSSGYAANLAALTALGPHGSLIVSDAGNHASIVDGCRLARAHTEVVAARRPGGRAQGAGHPRRRALVVSRLGVLGGRRRRPAGPTGRGLPRVRCRAGRGRRARARGARRGRARRTARGRARGRGRRGRHRHLVQVARQPGRRGPRPRPGHPAPGERGPHLHLRHRASHPRRPAARSRPCGCCARSRSARAGPAPWRAELHRRLTAARAPRGTSRCRGGLGAGPLAGGGGARGRPTAAPPGWWSAASGRRRCRTASRGSG